MSRAALVGGICGLLLVVPAVAGAEPSAADHLAQGLHYLQRGQPELARRELEAGRDAPGGATHAALHLRLARLYYDQLELEAAFPEARRAVELAQSPEQEREANELLQQMQDLYSGVVIRSASEEIRTLSSCRIEADGDGEVIGVQKKQVLSQLQARLQAHPPALPTTVYLPFGFYLIEGTPVSVQRGQDTEVMLHFARAAAPADEPSVAWRHRWWFVGGAAGLLLTGIVLLFASS